MSHTAALEAAAHELFMALTSGEHEGHLGPAKACIRAFLLRAEASEGMLNAMRIRGSTAVTWAAGARKCAEELT